MANTIDEKYLDLVKLVMREGEWRENRTGIPALTIPHFHIQHDMSEGFPLLTTKKMAIRSIAVELEGFLKGVTDKGWYEQRKCSIWREWANPKAVEDFYHRNYTQHAEKELEVCDDYTPVKLETVRKAIQLTVTDLGPIYGYQWRSFNKTYQDYQSEDDGDYHTSIDQLWNILKSIKNNPNDRRMVCSAWNPNQMHLMGLPPCHLMWKVNILGKKLHLCWFQRSCDLMLGIPYNIASYGLLQLLLCKYGGYEPGKLSGFLDDVHIYENQWIGTNEQLTRGYYDLPTLDITCDNPFEVSENSLHINWTHDQLKLNNYQCHPKIEFPIAV